MLVFHSKKSDAVSNKLQLSKSSLTKAVTTVTTVLFELTKEGERGLQNIDRVSNQPSQQLRVSN